MIIDSSAWIEFLRDTGSPACLAVDKVIADRNTSLMTSDVIRLELLAGTGEQRLRKRMNSMLAGCDDVRQLPRGDVDDAVALFQACRAMGETVRSPNNCLIAAIAIRVKAPVLHADKDFDVIARHSRLVVVSR